MGAWVAARLLFATSLPFPLVLLFAGLITMVLGTLVGLPALRMSGLYLALITLMLAGAITVALADDQLPQRRPRLHRLQRRQRPHPADPPAEHRHHRSRVLPLLGGRRGADVPAGAGPHPRAAGTGLGGDPPERVGRARGRHQHDVLQALGVRAGVVHHRSRGRLGGRQLSLPELADVHDPGLDHAAGGGADGRRVQHLGRDRGRAAAEVPAGAAQRLGRVAGLADDPVRDRRAPGPHDRARGLVDQVPKDLARLGRRCLRGSGRPDPAGEARDDRGLRTDRCASAASSRWTAWTCASRRGPAG